MSVLENFNKINECNHNPSIRLLAASHRTAILELNASFLSKFLKSFAASHEVVHLREFDIIHEFRAFANESLKHGM